MSVNQKILSGDGVYEQMDAYWEQEGIRHILLVCGRSAKKLPVYHYFEELDRSGKVRVTQFSDYAPNPDYSSVEKGTALFREKGCDAVAAIGGGSGMDVAKCIKLYAGMDPEVSYLQQKIVPNDIPFLAVPTTAGTGSEATRFAVVYYNHEKQSVSDESCIPSVVIMDPSVLDTLPLYQRKTTMLDALCHATESFWSVNSSPESKAFSRTAIEEILKHKDGYLANTPEGNAGMLHAAYIAGQAINLTQTTAGHAMCYKMTSLYGLAHGHSAMLCVKSLFPWMLENIDKCIDPRGADYLKSVMDYIAETFGYSDPYKVCEYLEGLYSRLNMSTPEATEEEFILLVSSVNVDRLKNHPIKLDRDSIDLLYHKILGNS